eukprot:gene40569-50183_t
MGSEQLGLVVTPQPSSRPSVHPSNRPSAQPSFKPSSLPSAQSSTPSKSAVNNAYKKEVEQLKELNLEAMRLIKTLASHPVNIRYISSAELGLMTHLVSLHTPTNRVKHARTKVPSFFGSMRAPSSRGLKAAGRVSKKQSFLGGIMRVGSGDSPATSAARKTLANTQANGGIDTSTPVHTPYISEQNDLISSVVTLLWDVVTFEHNQEYLLSPDLRLVELFVRLIRYEG